MTSRFITKAYGPGQNAVGEIGDDGEFVEYDVKPTLSSALDWVAKARNAEAEHINGPTMEEDRIAL